MARRSKGRLRALLESASAAEGLALKDLTVLAEQNDPFRRDTLAGHRDGEWLAMHAEPLLGERRTIHLRGLHYALVSDGVSRPDGLPYANDKPSWVWMSMTAAKASRWLGYLPFARITDERNAEPVVREFEQPEPLPFLDLGIEELPAEIVPQMRIVDFTGTQPNKLVLFGEKSSLEEILAPLCEDYGADLYLPSGEISDTLLHRMAESGFEDGRPMVVLSFSDCDPSGWQMPISIARKLQAFEALEFPGLEFEVRRVALVPDQVREHSLPESPIKETEKRAGAWVEAMGVEQTEIDALATLQPELLVQIAHEAIAPFFDSDLDRRVSEARAQWQDEAQARLDALLAQEDVARLHAEAQAKAADLRAQLATLEAALSIEQPKILIPQAEITSEPDGLPLISSSWSFVDQTQRLIDSRAYRIKE